jgi:hypothetical protein
MSRYFAFSFTVSFLMLGLGSAPSRAAEGNLSPEKLDMVDHAGIFTPGFKAAVHELVDSNHALEETNEENKKLELELPGLQSQAQEAQAKTVALRQELARYEHPEETDFTALQGRMNDASAKPEDQIAAAQAYVWAYPASPHESQAQQYLQQMQKKMADQQQGDKDAEAARVAAHAKLVQRAQAHDLSLSEWRDFLRDMSQDDLVKLFGMPTSDSDGYWIYSGAWVTDPASHQNVGIQINFTGGRVLSVDGLPPSR